MEPETRRSTASRLNRGFCPSSFLGISLSIQFVPIPVLENKGGAMRLATMFFFILVSVPLAYSQNVVGIIVDFDPVNQRLIKFIKIWKLQDGDNTCYIFNDLLNAKNPPVVNCLKSLPTTEVDHAQPKVVLPLLQKSNTEKVR